MRIKKESKSVGVLGKILNLFSNSKEDTYSCDYINTILKPTILYQSNEKVGKNSITLSDSTENYSMIDVEYGMINYGKGTNTVRIYNPNGKTFRIDGCWNGYEPIKSYIVHQSYNISNKTITKDSDSLTYAINGSQYYSCGSEQVYISKVVGYK